MPDDPRLAARGALLGAACGDALGAPFEGMPPADARDIRAVLEGTSPLRYTDDTAMTIALAESLIEVGGLDESHLAATFARHWRAEPWRGYGRGTFELLRSIAAGAPWVGLAEGQFDGRGSWGNGAAMRVAPVAVLAGADVGRAIDLARRSARVTHAHPLAVDGAVLQTVAITLAMRTAPSRPLRPALFLTRVRAFVREVPLLARLDRAQERGTGGTRRRCRDLGDRPRARARPHLPRGLSTAGRRCRGSSLRGVPRILHPMDERMPGSPRPRGRRILPWVPAVAWAAMIFAFSAQPDLRFIPDSGLDFVVRKLGHMVVFGILALLLWHALATTTSWRRPWAGALALTILYAISDELHQGGVAGRNASAADVGFDTLGALVAVAAVGIVRDRRARRRQARRRDQ